VTVFWELIALFFLCFPQLGPDHVPVGLSRGLDALCVHLDLALPRDFGAYGEAMTSEGPPPYHGYVRGTFRDGVARAHALWRDLRGARSRRPSRPATPGCRLPLRRDFQVNSLRLWRARRDLGPTPAACEAAGLFVEKLKACHAGRRHGSGPPAPGGWLAGGRRLAPVRAADNPGHRGSGGSVRRASAAQGNVARTGPRSSSASLLAAEEPGAKHPRPSIRVGEA